jgi:hypothetical protein
MLDMKFYRFTRAICGCQNPLFQRQSEQMVVFMLGRDNAALAQLEKMWSQSKEQAREV